MSRLAGLVLADDATGALECASLLAGLGLHASLVIAGKPQPGINVVDTESRHLPPAQAAARIHHWLAHTPAAVYKKTDSTLRGNIAAELLAMLESPNARPIVYVPAYPKLGRTVVNGELFVHGRPVAESDFASDLRHSVRTSRIAELFPPGAPIENIPKAEQLVTALRNPALRVLICDAASDADLDRLAAALTLAPSPPWLAGPAASIPAWAALHPFPRRPCPEPRLRWKWLIVCGSLHPQSRRQAQYAMDMNVPVIGSSTNLLSDPEQVAASLAHEAREYILAERPHAVFIMGGDTVWELWRALRITEITPLPELLPGVAASFSPEQNLVFVTKAGGFGDDSLVGTVLEQFSRI